MAVGTVSGGMDFMRGVVRPSAWTPPRTSLSFWLSPSAAYTNTTCVTPCFANGDAVLGLLDLSGNGHNATDAGSTGGLIWNSPNGPLGINGMPSLSASAATKGLVTDNFFTSAYKTACSFYMVTRVDRIHPGTNGLPFSCGGASSAYAQRLTNGQWKQQVGAGAAFVTTTCYDRLAVLWFTLDGSGNATVGINRWASAPFASDPSAWDSGRVFYYGCYDNNYNLGFTQGQMGDALLYNAYHSATERNAIITGLMERYGFGSRVVNYAMEGDSLTYTTNVVGYQDCWPDHFARMMGAGACRQFSTAYAGKSQANAVTDAPIIDACYDSLAGDNVCVSWVIANQIRTQAVATSIANTAAYCAARKAAGWKVIVLTCLARGDAGGGGWTADHEIARQAYNASLLANYRSYADAVADVAADSRIGGAASFDDTNYFAADKIHLTSRATAIVAQIVAEKVRGIVPSAVL